MVELRNLASGEPIPQGEAWVLIELSDGRFAVKGKVSRSAVQGTFSPHPFDTAEEAMKASVAWADLLNIPLMYVKGAEGVAA